MGGELAVPPERMRAATVRIPGTTSARSALCPGGSCKVSTGVSLATPRLLRKPVLSGPPAMRSSARPMPWPTRSPAVPALRNPRRGPAGPAWPRSRMRTSVPSAPRRCAERHEHTPRLDGVSVSDAVRAVDRGRCAAGPVRDEFGAALGHRFDQVRVHADESAAQSCGADRRAGFHARRPHRLRPRGVPARDQLGTLASRPRADARRAAGTRESRRGVGGGPCRLRP